ncbi:MAG: hypothetical protein A2017_08680 [Lentisphaerae bacterium GWF2_44_16]|nr:MAG: hypothetical protein A2017_08680 [Lentisphaerae bacterium GWF2_44_16]
MKSPKTLSEFFLRTIMCRLRLPVVQRRNLWSHCPQGEMRISAKLYPLALPFSLREFFSFSFDLM